VASVEFRPGRPKPYRVRVMVALRDAKTGQTVMRRRSYSCATVREAEGLAAAGALHEQDRRQAAEVHGPLAKSKVITVSQALDAHMQKRRAKGLSNVRDDESRADRIARDLGDVPVRELTRADVRRWKHAVATTPSRKTGQLPAAQTVKNMLNLLRTALADCVDRGDIEENPADGVKVGRDSKETRAKRTVAPLTRAELDAIVRVASPRLGLLATIAAFTGLRQGEMWALQHDDVVERDGAIAFLVRRGQLDGRATKSGAERVVPLVAEAEQALVAWRRLTESDERRHPRLVFFTERGAPLPSGKPPRGWFEALRAAGITRRIRWHDLRHTCGTWLANGTIGGRTWAMQEVRDFLGHASVQTTERYAHRREESVLRAVRETRRR
jgi:integrase